MLKFLLTLITGRQVPLHQAVSAYFYFSLRLSHAGRPQANFVAEDDLEHLILLFPPPKCWITGLSYHAGFVFCSVTLILQLQVPNCEALTRRDSVANASENIILATSYRNLE